MWIEKSRGGISFLWIYTDNGAIVDVCVYFVSEFTVVG